MLFICLLIKCLLYLQSKTKTMKVKRIQAGIYKVVDSSTWIAKGGVATMNGKWTAFDCENYEDCLTENNWGIQFDTFKELKQYVEYWSKKD